VKIKILPSALADLDRGRIFYARQSKGIGDYVPDLPGCVAVGETRREVLKLIREGVELHIEALREAGEPVPPPTSKSEVIKVRAA
jgi:predicted RNase H-like HicB family nuclease